MIIKTNSFAELYYDLLHLVSAQPMENAPRNLLIRELRDYKLVLTNPYSCFYTNPRRSSQFKYIYAEFVFYLMGTNKTDFIKKYSKFWGNIENSDGTINSAYGNLIFTERYNGSDKSQWEWAIDSLISDKDTRQAVMHFNKPHHQFKDNKDFVCTMYGIFMIRENRLHFTVHMRSNDVILGLPTDVPFFCLLQINMWRILKEVYPTLELGEYSHFVNSLHLYKKHNELVMDMLKEPFISQRLPFDANELISSDGKASDFITSIYNNICYNSSDPLIIDKLSIETAIYNHLILCKYV